jgi:flagellar FliJ protein
MKKFTFTLNRLLSYRERLLDEEKNRLGQLRLNQMQIEARIAELKAAFARLSRELVEEQAAGIPAFRLRSYNLKLTSLRGQLDQLRRDLARATAAVERQMTVVVEASREVSKLEKLEEKQLEVYMEDVRKAEAIELDEFVSSDTIRKMIS